MLSSLHVPGLVLLLLAAPLAGVGQEPAAPAGAAAGVASDEVYVDSVDVELVDLDVEVVDRAGKPVAGLGPEAFEVRDDGRVVSVTHFAEVGGEGAPPSPARRPGNVPSVNLPGELSSALGGASGSPRRPLWVVVYVDNFHLDALERNRIIPELMVFLRSAMAPGDQAMLVTHDRSLTVSQPFSGDLGALGEAVRALDERGGFATARDRERDDTLQEIVSARGEVDALGHALIYADSLRHEVEVTIAALEELIETLAGLPGRKVMVYVSSGVPTIAGEEMFLAVEGLHGSSSALAYLHRYDLTRQFERVALRANAHRVSIFTIDAGGLRANVMGSAEHREIPSAGLRSAVDSTLVENPQRSLRLLAEETGGRAILGTNRINAALLDAAAALRHHYSLGFVAGGGSEGGYHRLSVRVRGEGLRVGHRGGYRRKSTQTRMIETVRAALLYDQGINPLGIAARTLAAAGAEVDGVTAIELRIPVAELVLLPLPEGKREAQLDLYVAAADERGSLSEVESTPLGFRIADQHVEAARGESFLYTHRMRLASGRQKVALVVRDRIGAQFSVVTLPVMIPVLAQR
jgi:VWFA-related protein